MAKKEKDVRPEYASREEVEQAAASLSPTDELRLERFARFKVRGMGRKAMNRDFEDLLREAITSTWIGAEDLTQGRRWRKREITFVQHLLGAMRSIASHWKEAAHEDEAYLDSDLAVEVENGELIYPLKNAPSDSPDQERTVIAKQELNEIYKFFQDDDDAALVIEGIREGWTGPEIIDRLKMSKNKYEAAIKRIRYHLK